MLLILITDFKVVLVTLVLFLYAFPIPNYNDHMTKNPQVQQIT